MADTADQLLESYLGGKVPEPKGSDVSKADDILSSYLKDDTTTSQPITKITVRPDPPSPPISGATQEQSDAINSQPSQPGGSNPRRYSSPANLVGDVATGVSELPGDIARSTGEAARAGIDTFKSGAQDAIENRPATGVGKMGLGALQYVSSPVAGILKETVENPIDNLTGEPNPVQPTTLFGNRISDENIKIGSPGERAGTIAGAALPVAKLGKIVNNARPVNKAFTQLIDLVGKDNLPTFIADLKSNSRLSPMDVSSPVQQAAQKLVVTEGPHQSLMKNVVEQRLGSAKGEVGNIIDNAMGSAVDVKSTIDRLQEKARETGRTLINPVIKATPHTEVTSVIKDIDKEIGAPAMKAIREGRQPSLPLDPLQNELFKVRKSIRGDWPDRDTMHTYTDDLHGIQSRLRERAEALSNSSVGSERLLGKELMGYRQKLVDAIDKASGGTYKTGLKQYADDKQVHEAFDKGREILKNRPTKNEDDPSYWKHWTDNASPDELQSAREGARLAVRQQIQGMRNSVGQKGTEIPQIEFNKEKLSHLFGSTEIEEMSNKLQHERQIADTNKKLFENSQTAMRIKSHSGIDLPVTTDIMKSAPIMIGGEVANSLAGGPIGASTGAILALKIANRLKDKAKLSHAKAKNLELAKLVSATGPERQDLIDALSAVVSPPKQSLLSRSGNALARVIGP